MSDDLVITIPGQPVGKGRPRFRRSTGHAYTDEKTANAEAWIKTCAIEQVGQPRLEGPLSVLMTVICAVPQSWSRTRRQLALEGRTKPTGKPDLDNVFKTLDALNQIVWVDDSQIVRAVMSKVYGEKPGIVLTVLRG